MNFHITNFIYFNLSMESIHTKSKYFSRAKLSPFSQFAKYQKKGLFLSDSLKKINHFGKKSFNLHHPISSQPSPQKSFLSPQRLKKARRTAEHFKHTTFTKLAVKPIVHKNRHLRTEPYDSSFNQNKSKQKQMVLSTECSQHSESRNQPLRKGIQQYQLIKLIGRGKSGQVFLSVHKETGFVGALKVIEKKDIFGLESSSQQKMKEQLFHQIKIQLYLDHPNIVKLYDFFYDEARIYLFMELGTEGHLLENLSVKGKFEQETTSIITRQVAKGVAYMHSKKVIHRDLKLQNIVFTCGMAKLCDFGWSIYETKNFRSTICGTPLYLPPEILKGKKYNQKIDVWAIGTLCHEMATGKNPFGIKRQEELGKIVKESFEMKAGSPDLKNFVSFILKKEPEGRPTAEMLLKHPFIEKYGQMETAEELYEEGSSFSYY